MKPILEIESLWFDDQGRGPIIPQVTVGHFDYPTPGPQDHVGLMVAGIGGLSLDVDRAEQLAAALTTAVAAARAANAGKAVRDA